MQGRGAGYDGLDRARDYLIEHFNEAGLRPGFVDGSFTQPFEIDLGAQAHEQSLALINGDAFEPNGDFSAMGFSGEGAFAGEVVFVGYGIVSRVFDYDSYADLPDGTFKDKVVIAYRYEPMDDARRSQWASRDHRPGRWSIFADLTKKAKWAAQRGATALVMVNPPSRDDGQLRHTRWTNFGEPADIPVMHLRTTGFTRILEQAGRDPDAAMHVYEQRADRGVLKPDVLEGVSLAGNVRMERPAVTIHNVAGVLPGSGKLQDEVVILGAHYDHLGYGEIGSRTGEHELHPGADDNASGTAALIMLAQRLHEFAETHPHSDRRTILFVGFTGEERGLLGSRHLVNHGDELIVPLDRAVAMINLDMIGRLNNELLVFGAHDDDHWKASLNRANADVGLDVLATSTPVGSSDHAVFDQIGIPAIHFSTGKHDQYHTPLDTADRINAAGGAQVIELVGNLFELLATETRSPAGRG